MRIKLAAAAALAMGTLVATTDGAVAAGGCGPGFHPNPYGYCRPNYGPRFHGPRPFYRPYGFHGPRRFHRPGWGYGYGGYGRW